MKYITLFAAATQYGNRKALGIKNILQFRWEWRLEWEENHNRNDLNHLNQPEWWVKRSQNYRNRALMRSWRGFLKDASWCRNIVTKRRLVQVNWEDYNDSFTWNRNG